MSAWLAFYYPSSSWPDCHSRLWVIWWALVVFRLVLCFGWKSCPCWIACGCCLRTKRRSWSLPGLWIAVGLISPDNCLRHRMLSSIYCRNRSHHCPDRSCVSGHSFGVVPFTISTCLPTAATIPLRSIEQPISPNTLLWAAVVLPRGVVVSAWVLWCVHDLHEGLVGFVLELAHLSEQVCAGDFARGTFETAVLYVFLADLGWSVEGCSSCWLAL